MKYHFNLDRILTRIYDYSHKCAMHAIARDFECVCVCVCVHDYIVFCWAIKARVMYARACVRVGVQTGRCREGRGMRVRVRPQTSVVPNTTTKPALLAGSQPSARAQLIK